MRRGLLSGGAGDLRLLWRYESRCPASSGYVAPARYGLLPATIICVSAVLPPWSYGHPFLPERRPAEPKQGIGRGGRIRTDDLRVMSPMSCYCSTPLRRFIVPTLVSANSRR